MTREQADVAVKLLKSCLDFVGLHNLNEKEEEAAQELQVGIERLLVELGAMRAPSLQAGDPSDLYELVLSCRDRVRMAREECQECRGRLNVELAKPEDSRNPRYTVYIVRRYNLAYNGQEVAEAELMRAEADYYRALTAEGQTVGQGGQAA